MATQRTTSQSPKSIALAALVGIGLIVLLGELHGPTAQLIDLSGPAARVTLELLRCLVPPAWHSLQAYALDHQRFSPCPLQMLVSFWPLLHFIAGAV